MFKLEEVSQKIADHLTRQKAVSKNIDEHCKYRGDNGLMCAVGCLITDTEYNSTIEGQTVIEPGVMKIVLSSIAPELGAAAMYTTGVDKLTALLGMWQDYHDSIDSVEYQQWIKTQDPVNSPQTFHETLKSKGCFDV